MNWRLLDLALKNETNKKALKWELFANLDSQIIDAAIEGKTLQIDMAGFDYLNHDGLIWVASIALSRALRGKDTHIILPENERLLAYLQLIGFKELQVPLNIIFLNEYLFLESSKKYLAEAEIYERLKDIKFVTETNWPNILHSTAHYLTKYLQAQYDIPGDSDRYLEELAPFTISLRELIHNIALHGGEEPGKGMGLVSCTPPPKKYPLIRYCCSDVGSGFRATLLNKHGINATSEIDAICDALLIRYFKPKEGILGLYPTLGFIRKRNGRIFFRSGDCLVKVDFQSLANQKLFDSDYKQPSREWIKRMAIIQKMPEILGTHICVDLRLPS
jgi:hypothetical protein